MWIICKRKMSAAGLWLSSMRFVHFTWILLIFALHTIQHCDAQVNPNLNPNPLSNVHRRFEYKYSFKPPYLAQKDGTVPFWEYGGNAIASTESVRVAPSLRSQKGAIWTKQMTNFDWWEVQVVFRVTGRGRIGADGLAFWYTTQRGDYNGQVFGSSDRWNGLGVFFDSFDNDNKHNNPYIMAVVNDGKQLFDHQNDGTSQMLSGCLRDFRNKPFPTRARIEYYNNVLTVYFHNGMTNNNDDYELCLRADNVHLPKNGYFGISAATGGLADDHDVFHFLTTSLHAPGQLPGSMDNKAPEGAEKLTQEYKEYQEKLEKQKQEYKKEHPDEVKEDDEWEGFYESDNQRELRQIWQGQSQISDQLRDLSRKIDEVIGRQENTLSLVSRSVGGGAAAVAGGGAQQVPPVATGGIVTRHDVDTLINNHNILLSSVREIRQIIGGNGAPSGQPLAAANPYDIQSLVAEMRSGLNQVKDGMSQMGQKLNGAGGQVGCPSVKCVSVTLFLATIAGHLCILFLYSLYKSRNESNAKKFY